MKVARLLTLGIPLRWKVLLYSSSLLLVLIAAMLIYVNYQAERFVNERLGSELEQGRRRVIAVEDAQLANLRLTARLLASLSQLKALLDTDVPTIRDFLLTYQQENRGVDILMVIDPAGKVLARTDSLLPDLIPEVETRWVRAALTSQAATGILVIRSGVYNAVAVPAEAGGTVFGFVMAGSTIDDNFARQLRDVSQDEVVIVGDSILGSTLTEKKLPWTTHQAWRRAVGSGEGPRELTIGGESYVELLSPLGSEGELIAVCLQSRDRALTPYRRIQYGLLALGLFAAIVGIAGSAVLARTITAPLGRLVEGTRKVAAGDFDFRLELESKDEIGDLAQSFNTMIQGLRERADMQKFVSQSTVEMIHASSQKRTSAGERKRLTVFFSDMRGFTSLAERWPPEEVVKILNSCLSLQAEKVKKFHGDIDKYVGDCVVAVFSDEDMTLNAIRCAVEIHKALDAYNVDRPGEEPITVGIGIVTGEVILGSIGSQDRSDYTVVGSNVNLCARLCALAGPRETLLAESTYREVQDLIAAQRLDPISVKGFSEALPVYKMTSR